MIFDFAPIYSGSTWSGVSSIKITSNNTPIDLNQCEVRIKVRSFFNLASPVVCEFSNKDGSIIISDTEPGTIKIPPQNIIIPEGKYQYSLKVIFPSKDEKTCLSGVWEILPSVSRIPVSVRIPAIDSTENNPEINYQPEQIFTFTPQLSADSDLDGYTNISELNAATDPNDPEDFPISLFNVFNNI